MIEKVSIWRAIESTIAYMDGTYNSEVLITWLGMDAVNDTKSFEYQKAVDISPKGHP